MNVRQRQHSALLTDLYELTMAAAYFESRFQPMASFELFVRRLPAERGYLLAAGLEQALEYLEQLRFLPEEIEFVRRHPAFAHVSSGFFDYLRDFRFSGEVWAMPEGTVAFASEPLLRVTAPIIEGQVVETFLLSTITFQTMIATKAARVVQAAQGRGVVEFGTRRAHGPQAGVLAARAAYIAGCSGTSNVEAGYRFGIPTYGTIAHSFIMAHGEEREADTFAEFLRVFPDTATLLVDTYDTLAAVDKMIARGLRPRAVRLDSGNLVELSRDVRRRLDVAGLKETRIFVSGDLNEYAIGELLAQGAVFDACGVGTELATSKDAPTVGGVYKLVEVEDGGPQHRAKWSAEKATYPGRKQVFRTRDAEGRYAEDVLALADEDCGGEALLAPVMRDGARLEPAPAMDELRERAAQSLAALPEAVRRLREPASYPVRISPGLQAATERLKEASNPAGRKR